MHQSGEVRAQNLLTVSRRGQGPHQRREEVSYVIDEVCSYEVFEQDSIS